MSLDIDLPEQLRATPDGPDAYWYRCCTRDPGHEGPCVWFCSDCSGTGDCPECDGAGPELCGCETCDTTGTCPTCWGSGEFVDDLPQPRVQVETIGLTGEYL